MAVIFGASCPRCSNIGLVMMRRLDTDQIFAECPACETGYSSPALDEWFTTHDVYWERHSVSFDEAARAAWPYLTVEGQLPENGRTPTPEDVAAWYVLGRLPLERLPWWAADWLAQGYDGERLRWLAGEHGDDPFTARDLVPEVLAEIGVQLPVDRSAAANRAFSYVARECLDGRVSERDVAAIVDHIVATTNYDKAVYDLPLGQVYGLDDEWTGGWGRTADILKREIREACQRQAAGTA